MLAHDAFIFLFRVAEATVKGVGGSHMYTLEPPILYSETFSAESLPRSTPKMNKFKLFVPEGTVPLGLFLVAFPPPPVTFPATRLEQAPKNRQAA